VRESSEHDRREILRRVALGGAGLAVAGTVLNRVLLLYEEFS
jgi:hypothetical protein